MKKVIGYIRVSTDEQGKSGLGLEAQEAKIEAYCGLYELDIVSVVSDSASGKSLKRSGLAEALDRLKAGEAEGLIVAKLDRLTRNVRDMGDLLEEYFESRFSLHVVAEQIDTTTAAGRMVLNILTSVAQWERETIAERTRDALTAKKARKEKTGGTVPFGFEVDADGRLKENADEQTVIRMVRRLRDKGYSYQRIADALNIDGYTTKTGRCWTWQTVRRADKAA